MLAYVDSTKVDENGEYIHKFKFNKNIDDYYARIQIEDRPYIGAAVAEISKSKNMMCLS